LDPVTKKNWRDNHPNFHPKRVVFGLPHNYGKKDWQKVNGEKHERRSSPLLFHVHPVGNTFVGISIYLPARFLPAGEKINAGGTLVPTTIDWPFITDFLDSKVGNPPTTKYRFPNPSKIGLLP
jgi:hypothetical protein